MMLSFFEEYRVFRRRLALGLITMALGCGARTGLHVDGGDEGGAGGAGGAAGGEGGVGADGGGGGVGGVEQLALGAGHSCVRTFDGAVYCWGRNGDGQLGIGTSDDSLTPQRVALDERATYLAAGSFHTCAIGESGTIFCWGRNSAGQLGTGNAEPSTVPVRASMEPFAGVVVESIALGEAHSCATARDDFGGSSLLCWGSGESGQTGPLGSSAVPIVVSTDAGQVTAGAFHTCFVSASSATASCMGENTQLQCGVPGPNNISNPETPEGLEPIVDRVRAGRGNHTCAIEKSDFIHCWGENDSGQLGVFASEAATPAETTAFELLGGLVDVQAGFAHTCALAGSEVWCWGLNESGQLGTPGPSRPDPVMVLPMTGIIAIGVGTIHTCAMRSATEIYCWGGNAFGQLGNGTDVDSNSPVAVTLP